MSIYDAEGVPRAWAGRPSDTYGYRLGGPRAFFVTPSPLGLRLVSVVPVTGPDQRRLGSVAAEHVLSPAHAAAAITAAEYELATPLGPASLRMRWEGAGDQARPGGFLLRAPSGEPLVEVAISSADLDRARATWRGRVAAAVLAISALTLLLLIGPLLDRRAIARDSRRFARATAAALALVCIAAATLWMAVAAGAGRRPAPEAMLLLCGVAAAGLVALAASPLGRLRLVRLGAPAAYRTRPLEFAAANLAAGLLVAALVAAFEWMLGRAVDPSRVDLRHFSLYPWGASRLMLLAGILACHAAALWAGTVVLSAVLARWRVPSSAFKAHLVAIVLWLAPAAVLAALAQARGWPLPAIGLLASAGAAAMAALISRRVVVWYRHTTVAARILATFVAFLIPSLLLYPSVEFFVHRGLQQLVATTYAVEAENHPQELQDRLDEALTEIDGLPELPGSGDGSARAASAHAADRQRLLRVAADRARARPPDVRRRAVRREGRPRQPVRPQLPRILRCRAGSADWRLVRVGHLR